MWLEDGWLELRENGRAARAHPQKLKIAVATGPAKARK